MHHSLRILSTVLLLVVSVFAACLPPPAAAANQPLVSLQDFENLMDEVLQHRQRIQRYQPLDEYCLEPEYRTKSDDRELLDRLGAINSQLLRKFQFLTGQAVKSFGMPAGRTLAEAFPKINRMGPLDSGWGNPNNYWTATVWAQRIQNLSSILAAKRAEMESKPEVACRKTPPPKPQPMDWMRGLTRPAPEEITFAELPPRFCGANEKFAWIAAQIGNEVQQAADNARDAADYVVDVGRVMRQLEGLELSGTIDEDGKAGLKNLREEYKWAKDNLAKRDAEAAAIKAHAAKANAIPIVDCNPQPPQTGDGAAPIGQPDYEMFVYPQVPDRFCTEDEKKATLAQLDLAKTTARSNYEKAKAHAAGLQKRLGAGEKTPGLATAKSDADQAATTYYNLWIELDRAYYKAQAMPVVDCAQKIGSARTATGSGEARTGDWDYALRFAGEFGSVSMGTGGFFGFEVSPADRGVGVVRPNPSADARAIAAEINISLGSPYDKGVAEQLFDASTIEVFVRPHFWALEGDARTSGRFVTPGATLLPGLGGAGEAGFSLGVFPGFSNDIDWRYRTEQRLYDFGVEYGEVLDLGGPRLELAAGAGYYTATRDEHMNFNIPDFGASGSYSVKSDIDAPYVALRGSLTYPFGGGAGWTPYVSGNAEGRVYFYDLEAGVRFDPAFAASHVRNLDDAGTAFGWSAGLEAGVTIDEAAMQLYVGYRHVENELSPIANIPGGIDGVTTLGVTAAEIDLVVVGARVRF